MKKKLRINQHHYTAASYATNTKRSASKTAKGDAGKAAKEVQVKPQKEMQVKPQKSTGETAKEVQKEQPIQKKTS